MKTCISSPAGKPVKHISLGNLLIILENDPDNMCKSPLLVWTFFNKSTKLLYYNEDQGGVEVGYLKLL